MLFVSLSALAPGARGAAAAPDQTKSGDAAPAKPAAADDPNRAVEVRGQSRTLSMMLVLKNGKESIDFIKPRRDYAAEIATTPF